MISSSSTPKTPIRLVFIHGRKTSDEDEAWFDSFSTSFTRLGKGTFYEREMGEPIKARYLDILNGPAPSESIPTPAVTLVESDDLDAWRSPYNAQVRSLRDHLKRKSLLAENRGLISRAGPRIRAGAARVGMVGMKDVGRYCDNRSLRNACLRSVIDQLPNEGNVVIIAHSLGSVLAADLIYHLPPALNLRMLVTIGSPLGLEPLHAHTRRIAGRFPFERMGPWLNLAGRGDPIGAVGLNDRFNEVTDVYVGTNRSIKDFPTVHQSPAYLGHDVVAEAVDWVLEQRDVVPTAIPPVPIFPPELTRLLFAFQFAWRVEQSIENQDSRHRFGNARAEKAAEVAAQLATACPEFGVTSEMLLRDNSQHITALSTFEKVGLLVHAHVSNPIEPFEVSVDSSARLEALRSVAEDLNGLPSWADECRKALNIASDEQAEGFSWGKAGLVAGGLAVAAAAPLLVIAATPVGVAGGAAVMAGLSALGPGGVAGGLGIVGAVGAAGGAATAVGLTLGTSEEIQQRVVVLHASALAAAAVDETTGPPVVASTLREMSETLEVQRERLEKINDENSHGVKAIGAKIEAIRKALDHLKSVGLASS